MIGGIDFYIYFIPANDAKPISLIIKGLVTENLMFYFILNKVRKFVLQIPIRRALQKILVNC